MAATAVATAPEGVAGMPDKDLPLELAPRGGLTALAVRVCAVRALLLSPFSMHVMRNVHLLMQPSPRFPRAPSVAQMSVALPRTGGVLASP